MMKKRVFLLLTALMLLMCAVAGADMVRSLKITGEDNGHITYPGHTLQLILSGLPAGNDLPDDVTWTSAKPEIATVDENGLVTGVSRGSTQIRAVSASNPKLKATYNVNVRSLPESITLTAGKTTIAVGRTQSVSVRFNPTNCDIKDVVWSSSDPEVATVNNRGQVKAVAPGKVTITAACKVDPSISGSIELTEEIPVTKITFADRRISLRTTETVRIVNTAALNDETATQTDLDAGVIKLTYTTLPADATDPSVTFTSSNASVCEVEADGTLVMHKSGQVTITATTADGSRRTDRMVLTIYEPVTGATIDKTEIRVGVGNYTYLNAKLQPSGAKYLDENMTWTSSNTAVARVTGNGKKVKVIGRAWGDVTVTGVTEDGGYTVSALVHVGNYNKAVSITKVEIRNGKPYIAIKNVSNMNITHVSFRLMGYDQDGYLIKMSTKGDDLTVLKGSYDHMLTPGAVSSHGQFSLYNHSKYRKLNMLAMCITGYRTDDGFSWKIPEDKWVWVYSDPLN